MSKDNSAPIVYEKSQTSRKNQLHDDRIRDPIDPLEIFELIRTIKDPEHPVSLEQLYVIQLKNIKVDDKNNSIVVFFNPTIPNCTQSAVIGLCIRTKLMRSLPPRMKYKVLVVPGSHESEDALNRQFNDKERVAAALENEALLRVINKCILETDTDSIQQVLENPIHYYSNKCSQIEK
ncbi:hypothetical protein WA158_001455 [Blastocystis sp. Blastoise]